MTHVASVCYHIATSIQYTVLNQTVFQYGSNCTDFVWVQAKTLPPLVSRVEVHKCDAACIRGSRVSAPSDWSGMWLSPRHDSWLIAWWCEEHEEDLGRKCPRFSPSLSAATFRVSTQETAADHTGYQTLVSLTATNLLSNHAFRWAAASMEESRFTCRKRKSCCSSMSCLRTEQEALHQKLFYYYYLFLCLYKYNL